MPTLAEPAASYAERIAFVVELARRLHQYGTTAQRLEAVIVHVSHRMGLECEPWVTPTVMSLAFSDLDRSPGAGDITRQIRLPPGENDLYKLAETDRIAEDVTNGRLGIAAGRAQMARLDRPRSLRFQATQALGFGVASASIAGLLRLPWLDIATAGTIGLLIGVVEHLRAGKPRLSEASEAIDGMIAGALVVLVASLVAPLNMNTTIIASLVVLLPGLALTNAMNELTSQHLLSGTARFAGALTTVMKLTVGTAIALTAAGLLGLEPQVRALRPQPKWLEWAALFSAAFAFAVLFRAARRDFLVVMLASMTGYLTARWAGQAWGGAAGVFVAALVVTAAGNAFARWVNRPGAIVRVPGIILLVPGSVSLRGLMNMVQQQDASAGQEAIVAVMNILLALLAGMLFGNLLLPTRRNL